MKNKQKTKLTALKHSKCVVLGIALYFLIATVFVVSYKFDNSLSVCSCQSTAYKPSSFILKTLLYKEKVYAINTLGCGGTNSCLPNSYIFPIDLLTLGVAFLIIFFIMNEENKRRNKKTPKPEKKETIKTAKTEIVEKKKAKTKTKTKTEAEKAKKKTSVAKTKATKTKKKVSVKKAKTRKKTPKKKK